MHTHNVLQRWQAVYEQIWHQKVRRHLNTLSLVTIFACTLETGSHKQSLPNTLEDSLTRTGSAHYIQTSTKISTGCQITNALFLRWTCCSALPFGPMTRVMSDGASITDAAADISAVAVVLHVDFFTKSRRYFYRARSCCVNKPQACNKQVYFRTIYKSVVKEQAIFSSKKRQRIYAFTWKQVYMNIFKSKISSTFVKEAPRRTKQRNYRVQSRCQCCCLRTCFLL